VCYIESKHGRPHPAATNRRQPLSRVPSLPLQKYTCNNQPHRSTQVTVCKEQAEWARTEKRTFLRQRIELRLAALYLEQQDYPTALSLLGT